jgi:transcriptional regulator of acetoin/glycerol metabolism
MTPIESPLHITMLDQRGGKRRHHRAKKEVDLAMVQKMQAKGLPMKCIAAKLNMDRSTLHRKMKEMK